MKGWDLFMFLGKRSLLRLVTAVLISKAAKQMTLDELSSAKSTSVLVVSFGWNLMHLLG